MKSARDLHAYVSHCLPQHGYPTTLMHSEWEMIARALDLLARTDEGKVERFFLRNCYIEPKPSDFTPERPFDSIPGLDGYAIVPRETYDALKAERDALRQHAESLHDKLGRFLEFFHGYQSMEWKDSHEVYDAYRRDFPKDALGRGVDSETPDNKSAPSIMEWNTKKDAP